LGLQAIERKADDKIIPPNCMSQAAHEERVIMIREHLRDIPRVELSPGFTLRLFHSGDEAHWLRIHQAADRIQPISPNLFANQFGSDPGLLADRQFYLLAPDGKVIGTATAWFNDDFQGRRFGRLHWVAIVPEYQGRGLSKPLLSAVCHRLRELGHDCAYLTTNAARQAAINLYRSFGFVPTAPT
jgi:ribosomal protein S18 acetylase RimI-like enzyme